jgi:hypothetical protein
MITFRDALDDLEHRIGLVEHALDEGDSPELDPFAPSELVGPVGPEDVRRYEELMARLVACQTRVQLERVAVLEELSGLGRRRDAAAAYTAHG